MDNFNNLRELFNLFDGNKDGTLDIKELYSMIPYLLHYSSVDFLEPLKIKTEEPNYINPVDSLFKEIKSQFELGESDGLSFSDLLIFLSGRTFHKAKSKSEMNKILSEAYPNGLIPVEELKDILRLEYSDYHIVSLIEPINVGGHVNLLDLIDRVLN